MTLFKQINSLLFVIFLLVMATLVYFQFTQTREFMNQQMGSDLKNVMAALAIRLQPELEEGDEIGAEAIINVIFEPGFYRMIKLTWVVEGKEKVWTAETILDDGQILKEKDSSVVKGVPQWFVDFDLFGVNKEKRDIYVNWRKRAILEVEANPSLGYQQLWGVMNDTLMILSLLFLISIFFIRYRINKILSPLHTIAKQAKDIGHRKFGEQIEQPETIELRGVVDAINSMSAQLKQVFSSLDQEVLELKDHKLVDQVSKLPNRQYLYAQINNWLNEPGFGGLILAQFDWLEEIHSKYGYQGRDKIIQVLSERMQAELPEIAEGVIARIANAEFAFLLTKAEHHQIETYLHTLIRIINQEITKAGCIPNTKFALGVSQRLDGMAPSDLLSQSDNALQQARTEGKISHWIDAQQPQKYSREQWRDMLISSIYDSRFMFQWQTVNDMASGEIMQRELYCRLTIDDTLINASEFMPFIDLLSLGNQLDRCLLEAIEQAQFLSVTKHPVAINLTHDSIQDSEFTTWLNAFLQQSKYSSQMMFEIPESAVIYYFESCYALAEVIRSNGAKVGVDHCGRQLGTLDYLPKLQPHYIKLDQSYAYYEKQNQNNEMCRALINIAKGLSIAVIVTGIENKDQLQKFSTLRADGYQGYISAPEDIA